MLRGLALAVVLAGCEAPEVSGPHAPQLVLREELWGPFEHRVEVLDADPALGIGIGASTAPARVFFAETEDYLYVIDADGDPVVVRAVFAIVSRLAVDPSDPTQLLADPRASPNALRVDWSVELIHGFAPELGLDRVESVSWFLSDDLDPSPVFIRDESAGQIVEIRVPSRYLVYGDPSPEIAVLHVFVRASA